MPVKFGLTVKQVIEMLSKLDPDLEVVDEDHWPIISLTVETVYIENCPHDPNNKYPGCNWCYRYPCEVCRPGITLYSDYRDEE